MTALYLLATVASLLLFDISASRLTFPSENTIDIYNLFYNSTGTLLKIKQLPKVTTKASKQPQNFLDKLKMKHAVDFT